MDAVIRVMLVDDHAIVREGYRRLLDKEGDIAVIAEAGDGIGAYRLYKEAAPDVVIMDISMPGRGGIDVIRQIRQWDSHARILVFSMHANASYALQAFRAGAKGYMTKSSAPELLAGAVRNVAKNKTAMCPEIASALALTRLEEEASALERLSPREFEVLRMLLDAQSTEEIASALNVTPKTVANYHYAVKTKLGVSSDIDLVYYCMRYGVVSSLAEYATLSG
ncbi:Two component transcriptional regulator, LuxR family [Methylorubrum extorquens]|uniref:Two component transcriptional regulator, LuxR family n=1 Tax=Methylorubrum extorquens TaxID=408 RepID=A0A2N9AN28_METEX|nr:response regulator transcription factor [Methylorubrum extorquens]KQO87912.1 LuxR family transcriptional regulator [Methylobacterium sp. Leaf90]UYW29009.1 response regulator transcription factor [Methylorubrum extorquens]SOR28748.1 Two component transcriptional regulator, LuxR family [Methylorubrum extorquens]